MRLAGRLIVEMVLAVRVKLEMVGIAILGGRGNSRNSDHLVEPLEPCLIAGSGGALRRAGLFYGVHRGAPAPVCALADGAECTERRAAAQHGGVHDHPSVRMALDIAHDRLRSCIAQRNTQVIARRGQHP